jgi:aryl-alcohol dehydrogenase-like predicted oxidoreductase
MDYRTLGTTGAKEVENSLRRLQTDWIDLYQIHRPEDDTDIDETLGALTDLVRAGKVRYIGSSTFPPSQIVEARRPGHARRRGRDESCPRARTSTPPSTACRTRRWSGRPAGAKR